MLKPIVVPVDGSPLAEHALVLAVTIAKRLNAGLHLVRVREPLSVGGVDLVDWDVTYLEELGKRLQPEIPRDQLTFADLEPPVATTLIAYARAVHARMIVMSSRKQLGIRESVFSSVTDKVVREAGLPVLVCGPETSVVERSEDWDCEHILVLLDGSARSRQIVHHAGNLALGLGSRVTLLRVLPEPATTVGWPAVPFSRERVALSEKQEAEADLDAIAQPLRDAGVETTTRAIVTELPIVEAVEHEAIAADVIALATRGHGPAKRLAFGSVAHELTKRLIAPMLLLAPEEVEGSVLFKPDLADEVKQD